MPVVSAEGIAVPFTPGGVPYPPFENMTPALRSFRLTYPSPHDHEISIIQVLVGGNSRDVSPGADLSPANIPEGRMEVIFQDANPSSGEFFGYTVSHSILPFGGSRFQIRDVGCLDECVRALPSEVFGGGLVTPASVVALVGFKLFFIGGRDRQLDRIGVWFEGNDLHLAFRDRSAGPRDTYGYLVDFVVVPTAFLNVSRESATGRANALETFPLPTPSRAEFLLTGWEFNFTGRLDRRLLDIGVVRRSNDVTVFYGDAGGGEAFDWRVSWAHIAPMVIATT